MPSLKPEIVIVDVLLRQFPLEPLDNEDVRGALFTVVVKHVACAPWLVAHSRAAIAIAKSLTEGMWNISMLDKTLIMLTQTNNPKRSVS
jgi:hypothetical protein